MRGQGTGRGDTVSKVCVSKELPRQTRCKIRRAGGSEGVREGGG